MENITPKFNHELSRTEKIDNIFLKVWEESIKNKELKMLLEQVDIDNSKTIFELIKENITNNDTDPEKWTKEYYAYGHIGVMLNKYNANLAKKSFIIPVLNIKIEMGKIRKMPYGKGMFIIWGGYTPNKISS